MSQQVEVLLSCGHPIVQEIEAEVFAPVAGGTMVCPRCGKKSMVSRVGIPYHKNTDEKAVPPPGQKTIK